MPTANVIRVPKLTVDASVAVKWFSIEEQTAKARTLAEQAQKGLVTIYAPDLLLYEVENALWKSKKFEAERLTETLKTLFDSEIEFVGIDQRIGETAVGFMIRYDLTFYDAVYLGLAYTLSLPLLTSDLKYYRKVKEVQVIDLAKASF